MMGSLTALIIDAEGQQPSLAVALENAGFQVIRAWDTEQGVRRALGESPSIVVVSEDMPSLAGVEMLPLLRRLTDSPIVTLGVGGKMRVIHALLNGADVYLALPVNPTEFMARIRALLRRYSAARPRREFCSPGGGPRGEPINPLADPHLYDAG